MNEFRNQSPLFAQLRGEFNKITESGAKLSDKVDKLVMEIKNTADEKKKQKMLEKLLVHIHPLLGRAVSNFYWRYSQILSKQGFTEEDVYTRAAELLINCVNKWEDRETRKSKGEVPTHFTSYFLDKTALNNSLKNEFIRPFLYQKRTGEEVSLNEPVSRSILWDQKTENPLSSVIKNQEIEIGRGMVLNKLYTDTYPFLSLMAILRFGLGKDVLYEWKKKFDLSVKGGKIRKDCKKYIPRVDPIMEKYDGEGMTYQEIGDLLGFTYGNVKLRLELAIKKLRE